MNVHNISAIDGMEGHEFEYFCAELLRAVGFKEVKVTPGSGDQGVDILASKDGIKYAIQCKNYASSLGNTPVQEVVAGKKFYGCHVAVVMTNSKFTAGAIELANATNVLLWDRNKLKEFISLAGGLERFGIYQTRTNSDNSNTNCDAERSDTRIETPTVQQCIEKSTEPRNGMRIWANICYGWSVLCFIMSTHTVFTDKQAAIVMVGGGLFGLVFGVMFRILEKTSKWTPFVTLCGKSMKKTGFIIVCIVIAYMFLLGAASIAY